MLPSVLINSSRWS